MVNPWLSTPRTRTEYVARRDDRRGERVVRAGEPGEFKNAVRQLSFVLVNVPEELMYRPEVVHDRDLNGWRSADRPRPDRVTGIRPSVKVSPPCGTRRFSLNTGATSPG